jgi:hypothetical protein
VHGRGDRGVSAGQLERLAPGTRIIEQGSNDRGDVGAGTVSAGGVLARGAAARAGAGRQHHRVSPGQQRRDITGPQPSPGRRRQLRRRPIATLMTSGVPKNLVSLRYSSFVLRYQGVYSSAVRNASPIVTGTNAPVVLAVRMAPGTRLAHPRGGRRPDPAGASMLDRRYCHCRLGRPRGTARRHVDERTDP